MRTRKQKSIRASALFSFNVFFLLTAVTAAAIEKIKIGVSTPLSGEGATYGHDYRNTFLLANELLAQNAYTLIFEDDRCNGREGVTVAHKFAHAGIRYVLGVNCDGVFSSAGPIYEKNQMVVVSSSSSWVPGKHLFHTTLINHGWPKFLLAYIKGRHARLGVIGEETGFAQDFGRAFMDLAPRYGLTTVDESFDSGLTDFVPILGNMRRKGVDAFLVLTQTEASLLRVVRQMRQLKIEFPIYNVFFAGSASFLASAGRDAEDLIFLDFPSLSDSLTPAGHEVFDLYVTRFGQPKSGQGIFVSAFEAFRALHGAIQSRKDPLVYLHSGQFTGLEGQWRFDQNGFWVGPRLVIKKIENGRTITIKE